MTAGQFGLSSDLIVAGQVEPVSPNGTLTNAAQGIYYKSSTDTLELIPTFYFDAYNIFNGATVAASDAAFTLPAGFNAAGGGSQDLVPAIDVILKFLVALPDSTYACDYCLDPAPGTWSVWGSDGQKAAAVSVASTLEKEAPKQSKVERDALLDDLWKLVSDPDLGVTNEEARYELKDQIDYVKAQP